jgi:hypothetical protein
VNKSHRDDPKLGSAPLGYICVYGLSVFFLRKANGSDSIINTSDVNITSTHEITLKTSD